MLPPHVPRNAVRTNWIDAFKDLFCSGKPRINDSKFKPEPRFVASRQKSNRRKSTYRPRSGSTYNLHE